MATTRLYGPSNLIVTIDTDEVFPNDPGQGTPVMVQRGNASATFNCAFDNGILLDSRCREIPLSDADIAWMEKVTDRIDHILNKYWDAITD